MEHVFLSMFGQLVYLHCLCRHVFNVLIEDPFRCVRRVEKQLFKCRKGKVIFE